MVWFYPPPRTVWDVGAIEELPAVLERATHESALIVSDQGVVDAGLVSQITDHLQIETRTFDDIAPNPSRETVDRLVEAYAGEDVVIAVGGGSVMDAAKAATALPTVASAGEGHSLDALRDWPIHEPVPSPDKKVPLVLVPTTAGTGSETGHWAVISDPDEEVKLSVGHRIMAADVVVLDPSLTTSLPPSLTASSGFDVIAHSVEAFVATGRTQLTQPAAEAAYRRAVSELQKAVEDGDSIDARAAMLAASYLAGVAMNNAGLGAVHAISHAIGGLYDTPHGHTNALLLPSVIRRNTARSDVTRSGYAELAVGSQTSANGLADQLAELGETVGIGRDLPGLPPDPDWTLVAERAVSNVNMETNPAGFEASDVIEICQRTFD